MHIRVLTCGVQVFRLAVALAKVRNRREEKRVEFVDQLSGLVQSLSLGPVQRAPRPVPVVSSHEPMDVQTAVHFLNTSSSDPLVPRRARHI